MKTRKFSPIIAIEPYIIQVVSHLAKMLTPNSVYTGLLLVNSIIMDTLTYDSFLEWKQIHQPHCSLRNTRKCALGTGYWRGFMKRNKHLVTSKNAVKFDSKHADWCTYQNFETMYT